MMQIIRIFKAELLKIAVFLIIFAGCVAHGLNTTNAGIGKILSYLNIYIKF